MSSETMGAVVDVTIAAVDAPAISANAVVKQSSAVLILIHVLAVEDCILLEAASATPVESSPSKSTNKTS